MKKWVIPFLLAAGGYFLAGKLALLLAIPPGYATAVWPSAGWALAALLIWGSRVWPAIWIGSLLTNLSFQQDQPLLVPLLIGLGAAMQASLGATLIRRFSGEESFLSSERGILRFLFLFTPVSCLVAPSLGTAALYFSKTIPEAEFLVNWATWFVGDTIGVWLVTPMFAGIHHRAGVFSIRWKLSWVIPILLTLGLVVSYYSFASSKEREKAQAEFRRKAELAADAIAKKIENYFEVFYALDGLFRSSQEVDAGEFRTFVSRYFLTEPGLFAMSWNVRVKAEDRLSFEAQASRVFGVPYTIQHVQEDGTLQPAGKANEYFPVYFLEPVQLNERAIGFDGYAEPTRRAAMELARDMGEPVATSAIPLVQGDRSVLPGVVIYLPVYWGEVMPITVAERRQNLRGYVAGVFRVNELINTSLRSQDLEGLLLEIKHSSGAKIFATDSLKQGTVPFIRPIDLPIPTGSQAWSARFQSLQKAGETRNWTTWTVLAGGMILVSFLEAFLLVVSGRTLTIQEQVSRQTSELRTINENLLTEVQARKTAEIQLEASKLNLEKIVQLRTQDLKTALDELSSFAYAVSHDCRTPLRAIDSNSTLLLTEHELNPAAQSSVHRIKHNSERMARLVDGLLEFIHLGQREMKVTELDMEKIVRQALQSLEKDPGDLNLQINLSSLPAVKGDSRMIEKVWREYLGNALKFSQNRKPPVIVVGGRLQGAEVIYYVQDNGVGFEKEYAHKLFRVFERLHAYEEFGGVGIGLAIVHRVVERHRGRVWAETLSGNGACFYFSLPIT